MILEKWAPKVIGWVDNPNHEKIHKKLIKESIEISKKIKSGGKNWVSKCYNTLDTYDISLDEKFKNLNDWIFNQVNEYGNYLNYKNKFKCSSGWISLYKKYDFQEYHTHNSHAISAVYFLKSNPKKSSKILFRISNDPVLNEPTPKIYTRDNSYVANYSPVPGRLLLFKSDPSRRTFKFVFII